MSQNLKIQVLLNAIDKLTAPFRSASKQIKSTSSAIKANKNLLKKLESAQERVKKTGLPQAQERLKNKIEQTTQAIKKQNQALDRLNKQAKKQAQYDANVKKIKASSERLYNLGQRSLITGTAMTAPVVATGKGVASMAQTAGKFEQFKMILETVEGSSEKANQSFEWVKKFAVDTPANLDEAMEAFVRLKAYGLDPTNGLMHTLSDTAAAMGKPVMQAVEAIADAVTGENERLKEFGIKGSAIKGTNFIEYSYTDKDGKQRSVKVDKNNRKQIESTLKTIWNEKYKGAAEKQSKTLVGIWSKVGDVWTNFQTQIMGTGVFDWIKGKLEGVLATLDEMQKNGELQKWAEDIGSIIKEIIQGLWAFGEKLIDVVKKVAAFARENKGAIASIVKWGAVIGSSLTVFGALSMVMSFALYPVARLIYGIGHLTKINQLFTGVIKNQNGDVRKINKAWLNYKTTLNAINSGTKKTKNGIISLGISMSKIKDLPTLFMTLLTKMKSLSFWLNSLKIITRIALSPLRLALSAIGLLFSPIGLAIAGISIAGIALYKNWEKVKAFFGGFWEGLKQGLAPILEKFKPLGDAFGVVVGWIEKAVKWVMDFIAPTNESAENLDKAASAGKKFGEWTAKAIELALTPLSLVIEGVKWVIDNLPTIDRINESTKNAMTKNNAIGDAFMSGGLSELIETPLPSNIPPVNKWSGGYAGNGGKYQPMGVFHGGEYIMTKEATTRLGVPLLNALNYGKKAMLTAGVGMTVATAQPFVIDNRPPLNPSATHNPQSTSQPMQVTININAATGQSAVDIAREVEKALARIEQQKQARARSSLRDRD